MAKIAGQRSKDAGQDAEMQDYPAKSGTVGKFAMYSAEVKFVSLINHKLQCHIQHYGSLRPSKCIKNNYGKIP